MAKLHSLLQTSGSHDPSEIILKKML